MERTTGELEALFRRYREDGDVEAFSWSFDVFNGPMLNGDRSGHLYILRVLWNSGRLPGLYETTPEDAFGAGDEPAFTIGGTVIENDVDSGDAGAIAFDAMGTVLPDPVPGMPGTGAYS